MLILALFPGFDLNAQNEDHFFQDRAASLVMDGNVITAIDRNRFSKIENNDMPPPLFAIVRFILADYALKLKDVDKVAVLGTESHLNDMFQTYYSKEHPTGGVNIGDYIREKFQQVFNADISHQQVFFINPHLAGAVNSFTMSGYDRCLLLSINQTNGGYSFMILNGEKDAIAVVESLSASGIGLQRHLEEKVTDHLIYHGKKWKHLRLCITGDTVPPASFEENILSAGIFKDIFTHPLEHDANWAIGAGLYLWSQEYARQKSHERNLEMPRDSTEKKLTKVWQKILSKQNIGINDDFFHLGGNSLKAIVMENEIHKEFNVKLPLTEIFKYPTIKELSRCIAGLPQNRYAEIEPMEKKQYYRLSSAQQRMYFIQQIDRTSTAYNTPNLIILDREPDRQRLEETVKKLIARHESFRTSFQAIEEEPVQRIHHDTAFKIQYFFSSPGSNPDNKKKAGKLIRDFVKPFDLSKVPLLRVSLIKIEEIKTLLMIDLHHIITDGISAGILAKDFNGLYGGKQLPPLRIQYKDYAQWQKKALESEIIKQQEEYWLQQFTGKIPVLDLYTDFPRPEVQSFEGDVIYLDINEALTRQIVRLGKETGVTLNILLLAVYSVLLAKYSDQEDLVIATATAGRHHADLQQIIGMFVNMLPIRIQPGKNKTFKEFLVEVKQQAVNAYENQDYQFDDLVLKLGLQGNRSRNPVFDTVFVVQDTVMQNENLNMGRKDNDDNDFLDIPQPEFRNQAFDLILQAVEGNERLNMWLEYSTALFKKSTAEKMTNHYIDILKQIVENPNLKLKEILITHDFLEAKPGVINQDQTDFRF